MRTPQKEIKKILKKFINSENNLSDIFEILEKNKIRYGIFAGACVSFLTSNREPTDIDILIADHDFVRLTELIRGKSVEKTTVTAKSRLFYPEQNERLEFVSNLDFIVKGKNFPIRLTKLSWENVFKYSIDGINIILLNPADTILEKAISPRGPEVGKHDLEDIDALFKNVDIDVEYLLKRAEEMDADEGVWKILSKYNVKND